MTTATAITTHIIQIGKPDNSSPLVEIFTVVESGLAGVALA